MNNYRHLNNANNWFLEFTRLTQGLNFVLNIDGFPINSV